MKINSRNIKSLLAHAKDLESLGALDGIEAYNTLCKIENRAHKLAEDLCNYEIADSVSDKKADSIRKAVLKVFQGTLPAGFFINYDPRGYALKIKEENNNYQSINIPHFAGDSMVNKKVINYTDWGGYGILAPEFDN